MSKPILDIRTTQLTEISYNLNRISDTINNKELRNQLFTYHLWIDEAIAYMKAQQEALKSYEEAIKKLREDNQKLLLGDYFDKLKVQQNNLLSAIQGYLEDLKI